MTLGERLIRPEFSKTEEVRELKRQFVILVDKMDTVVRESYLAGEVVGSEEYSKKIDASRCANKAISELETAAMYAVKALTA